MLHTEYMYGLQMRMHLNARAGLIEASDVFDEDFVFESIGGRCLSRRRKKTRPLEASRRHHLGGVAPIAREM